MESFIESVRKYPCLWKSDIPEYKNIELKDAAWREVVKECRLLDVKEAKTTWKKLRDGHRQALARKKTTTGQAAGIVSKWKYEQQMEFLLPTMLNRPRQSNVSSPDQEERDDDSAEVNQEPESEDSESPYGFASDGKKQPKLATLLENEKKKREKRCAERDLLRKQILDLNSNHSHHSALEKFFASMFETTSNLPDRLQIRVQRQVFNIVMEAQEEHLTTQAVNSTPGPSKSILQTPTRPLASSTVYNVRGGTSFRLPSPISPRTNSTLSNYSENENSGDCYASYNISNTRTPNVSKEQRQYNLPHASITNTNNDNESMIQHSVEEVYINESANDLNVRTFIQDCNLEL